jgi:hypothetical protein
MKVIHEIQLNNSEDLDYADSVGVNDFIDESTIIIIIFLENFHFRKNVDYKKVSYEIDNIFLIELLCSFSRIDKVFKENDLKYSICGHGGYGSKCPFDHVIEIKNKMLKNKIK